MSLSFYVLSQDIESPVKGTMGPFCAQCPETSNGICCNEKCCEGDCINSKCQADDLTSDAGNERDAAGYVTTALERPARAKCVPLPHANMCITEFGDGTKCVGLIGEKGYSSLECAIKPASPTQE